MAIVIEEERRKGVFIPVLIWGIIALIIIAAIYFLFFKQPELIPLPPSPSLQNTDALANIQFDPKEVTENFAFKALHVYVSLVTSSVTFGRPNPFLPY